MERLLRKILVDKLPQFERKLKRLASCEVGTEYILEGIKGSLTKLGEQLSLFGEEDDT